jgi:hypothetical protein
MQQNSHLFRFSSRNIFHDTWRLLTDTEEAALAALSPAKIRKIGQIPNFLLENQPSIVEQ